MPINGSLLESVCDYIKEHRDTFTMKHFNTFTIQGVSEKVFLASLCEAHILKSYSGHVCGTSGCIAGMTVLLAYGSSPSDLRGGDARNVLRLAEAIEKDHCEDDYAPDYAAIAAIYLGIDDDLSQWLFMEELFEDAAIERLEFLIEFAKDHPYAEGPHVRRAFEWHCRPTTKKEERELSQAQPTRPNL